MTCVPVKNSSQDEYIARLSPPVAAALRETEQRLEELVPAQLGGLVPIIYQHVLKAGGKRLRPLLTLLSTSACGGDPQDALTLAVAVEVLHLASLIHDDVIDEASQRRGRPSVRQQWGNRASILVGDFLVAEVFRRMADELGRQALSGLARAVADMCQAELAEQAEDPGQVDEETYYDNIRGKTGALIAAACEIGAIAAHNEAAREPLATYGMNLGQAFQIVDDLLDLYGDEQVLGKPVLQDLARGQWTLPVIYALRTSTGETRENLTKLLLQAVDDAGAARAAACLTRELGGEGYAQAHAAGLIAAAGGALSALPDSPARESLLELSEYVLRRQY